MSNSTTVVDISGVSKRFVIHKEKSLKERLVNFGRSREHREDFWALRDVDLTIASGETVGLVGANGSGKSTLLKLIGGIMQPTSGQLTRRGRLAALIELGAGFHPDLTGRENVYLNCSILGLSKAQTAKHFDSIVAFSGIEKFIDTQVKFYSSGMYIRLAFAVAVHVDPDVLLVDEVLAVGDEPFQRKCMDRIRSFQSEGRTIILVSHALEQVAEVCDRAVVLEHGVVQADDEPIKALRVLREDFDSTRQQDLDRRVEESGRAKTDRPHVVSVSLNGVGSSTTLRPGDDLKVSVTVASPQLISGWVLGVGITTSAGQGVFGTHTRLLGVQPPEFVGQRTFTMMLPRLSLGEGSYLVDAAVADAGEVELDRLRSAASFRVESDGRTVGPLFTTPEFSSD